MLDAKNGNGEGINAMMVLKVLGALVGLGFAVVSTVAAYYSIIDRISKIDNAVATQSETLKSFATSIKTLADQALTEQDLRMFCLQAQISNAKWVCPYSAEPAQTNLRQRRVRTLNVTSSPPAASANVPR